MFLKNAWYVAAWSTELGRSQFERTICAESILFYRSERGEPVAVGTHALTAMLRSAWAS